MFIKLSVEEGISTLQLHRPQRANAYNRAMLEELDRALEQVRTPVLILTAAGQGAFCGGADLKEMGQADPLDALDLYSQQVFQRLATHQATSIAVVQGPAVAGGCELALACDFRVAGPRASFSLPETALGLVPAAGGSTRLPRLIGVPRAKEVILLGHVIDAAQALDWGLVTRLGEQPLGDAQELAATLLQRDPVALRLARQLIDGDLEPALARERLSEALLYQRKGTGA